MKMTYLMLPEHIRRCRKKSPITIVPVFGVHQGWINSVWPCYPHAALVLPIFMVHNIFF